MASTLYVQSINLIPSDGWYEGLEVVIEAKVGCFDIPCEYCKSALYFGLSSATSLTCGSYPTGFEYFDMMYVDVACGSEQTFTHTHIVTSADIDLIKSGVRRCCVFIMGGLSGMCYEYDSVSVADLTPDPDPDPEPSQGKGDLISVVAEPTTAGVGDRVYIYGTIKNIGESPCMLKLKALEGTTEITNSGGAGWVQPGETIDDIMMQFSMLDHKMNITVQVVRET